MQTAAERGKSTMHKRKPDSGITLIVRVALLATVILLQGIVVWAQAGEASSGDMGSVMAQRLRENWPLFSVLGGLALVSFIFFLFQLSSGSRRAPAVNPPLTPPPPQPQQPAPWTPNSGAPTYPTPVPQLPQPGEQQQGAPYAGMYATSAWERVPQVDSTPAPPQDNPSPSYGQSPGTAEPVGGLGAVPGQGATVFQEPIAVNMGATVFQEPIAGFRAETPAATPQGVSNPPSENQTDPNLVSGGIVEAVGEDVFMTGEDDRTLDHRNPTLTLLPAYFEVVASGDGERDPIGARKKLYSLDNQTEFQIARPTNGQDRIANFIPLQSKRVSRNPDKQGRLMFDFASGTYVLRNLADPTHPDPDMRSHPLRYEGRPMTPGEEVTLKDGDRIQVGDVMLRFNISSRSVSFT